MLHTFKLKKGELSFEKDMIVITDDASQQKRRTLLTSGVWAMYGTLSVLRYLKTGDQFLLWTGLFIGIAHLVVCISALFRTVEPKISFDDIKSIKVKRRFGDKHLDIRLKNNRLRRVSHIDDSEELNRYIEAHISATI